MAGRKSNLFHPQVEGAFRDPRENNQINGNIVNPPRYAQMGGLTGASKALTRNAMAVEPPGQTQRKIPARNTRGE